MRLFLCSLLALTFACDQEGDAPEKPTEAPEKSVETVPADKGPAVPKLRGAIELPAAVPSDIIAAFAVRVPKSMFESILAADPMGIATEGMDDLKSDLDAFLDRTVGIKILDATSVAGFARGEKDFGVVIEGVGGGIKAAATGEHAGVTLHGEKGNSLRMAQLGDALLVGTESAVKASIDASKSGGGGGELGKFIAAQSEGATLAIAADVTRLPAEMLEEIPESMRVERGIITFDASGLRFRAEGEEAKVGALAGLINSGLAMATAEAETQRKRAMDRSDDVAEGAAMIIGAHYMRSMKKMLVPKVEGRTVTIEVPIKAGDPAILAAVAGIGAAIAIPAFTKYTRRAKTSEARIQIAKMFDGASAYFSDEHLVQPAPDLIGAADVLNSAPHRCPNNGKLKGESGITPPLSVDCSDGPGGRCVPTVGGGGGPGYYDISLWTDNDVWNGLVFQQEQGHYFHYNFIWSNEPEGYGACQFTAQAFGDLDGDGVFSTYERSGAADENGVNGAAGLYIDREVE